MAFRSGRASPFRLLLTVCFIGTVGFSGVVLYDTPLGLGIRAQFNQSSGMYLNALRLYEDGQVGDALRQIKPLVEEGHLPSLNLVCGFVQSREPVAATVEQCVDVLENQPNLRLDSLTEIAIWAQEWDVATALLEQRLAQGDIKAHFDRARLIRAAPPGHFSSSELLSELEKSNAAQDPRGQYASVVLALDVASQGALSPVIAELLDRQPKLTAADAYFELAKLMQTGAVSSDISYVEVLRRADASGNPHAARYLAQYFIANPSQDPTGSERLGWMERAANSGDPVAQYNLAVDMLNLPPESRKMQDVVTLLDKSAASGFVPAINLLGATLWQMPELLPGPVDEAKAKAMGLMESAASKDDINAHFNLGNIFLSMQAPEKGVAHLRKAAALGSEPARQILVQLGEQPD